MNAWRKELQGLLAKEKTVRPPALRRSLEDAFLYATDLPALLSPEALEAFRKRAEGAGWRTERTDRWLQLTRIIRRPPEGWRNGAFSTEAAACASLLRRWRARCAGRLRTDGQPEGASPTEAAAGTGLRIQREGSLEGYQSPDGQREAILLVKAGEIGEEAMESACRTLHREWAALLRQHRPLPEMDLSFFTETDV